ncbi:hypothetical protein HY643_01455 [Candidatus Woesearchaeota archaeon]|nr:hypothetical protein [Candidatus Woesearchaeota archaeon]
MAYFQTAATEFINPLAALWNSFASILPGLIAAIIIIAVGYFIAIIIGHAIRILLDKAGLDKKIVQAQLSKAIGHIALSSIIGELIKWYIFVIFLQAGVDQLRLGTLSDLLGAFALWIPNLIAGVIVVIGGLFIGHFIANKIVESSKMKGANFMASIFKVVIIFITVVMALEQIGIEVSIVNQLLLVVIAAFGLGLAIALGIGFGLGLKSEAPGMIKDLRKYL